ncbi:hypothetical protein [Gimesia fumaroli]|uniref:Uncharacterized protein n=1 Tax=Gimesia fumaroli TaxID=2527976 RepID=A0A518IH91_9PLAN|nr:hypothetical protein [Gimesia fumaroli]QDV52461.1 hypothetical protein Enr17x_45240 [Gimesia fumaroli]
MAIQFNCPYCTSTLKVPDSTAGKQGDCPRCGTKLLIPNPTKVEVSPAASGENVVPPSLSQAVTPPETGAQSTNDQESGAPLVSVESRPMSSMTSQYLRKRRRSNAGGVLLFLLFFGLMLGVAGYFYFAYGPNLEGNLVAARFDAETAKLEQRLKSASLGVSEDVVQAVNQSFKDTPRRVQSDLMEVLFYGPEKGGLFIRLKAGSNTELVRVDLTGDPALMDYISKNGVKLDQPRISEFETNLNKFYTEWYQFLQSGGVMPDLLSYRNKVGLNSLMGGLGYHMEARVNNKIYPCVHDDFQGGLYFLVPRGTLQFEILGRKMDQGWTFFPGKYQVQVTQEYSTTP